MSLVNSFPTAVNSFAHPTASTMRDDPGYELHDVVTQMQNAITTDETKLGVGATVPARGKALVGGTVAGASVWDGTSRKNKLYNGDMRVSQRGTLGSTDNSYTLDRWRVLMEAATACVVTQEPTNVPSYGSKRAMKLTVGAANNNKFGLWQVLEFLDVGDLRAKMVSLQASLEATAGITDVRMAIVEWNSTADAVSGDPISSWNAAGTNPTLNAGYTYLNTPANLAVGTADAIAYLEGVSISAGLTNLAVMIWVDDKTTTTTTDFLIVTDVQLEEGAVCTGVERTKYAESLSECERYFWRIEEGGSSGTRMIAWGSAIGATLARVYVQFPTRMRGIPTASFNGTKAQYAVLTSGAGFAGTVSNVTLVGASPQMANLEVTITPSGLTAGDATALTASGATSAFLEFSAEL